MSQSSSINFGVCGIGRMGRAHAKYFSESASPYRLVAVCDREAARSRELAEDYNCNAYDDINQFCDDPDMELVIISTPSLLHAKNAQLALDKGKTVLLEKPIAVTTNDYLLLQKLLQKYPERLFFGHNHRFEPAFENAREIVASGLIGKPVLVKLCKHHDFMRRNDWQMRLDCGGGQLSVWGPHLIDQGLQWLGEPAKQVHSQLQRVLTPGDGDDHVKISLSGTGPLLVEIEISNCVAIPGPYCTIYGDRGALLYQQNQKNIELKYLSPEFVWDDIEASSEAPKPGEGMHRDHNLPWISEIRPVQPEISMWAQVEIAMAIHLYNALRNNIPFPVSSSDAMEVVRVSELVKAQNPQFNWAK